MSDNETKLIRNSAAKFLIFTCRANEQSIEARHDEVEPLLSAVTRRRRK